MGQSYSLALFQAASRDDKDRIRLLLNQGADVDAKDEENGWTALHHAVWAGNSDAVRELLVGGANVDARDNELKTPLHYAVLGGHESIMSALCNHGAAVNASDNWGTTPLHKAATQGQLELAQELVARGADENARLQDGSSAIHLASWKGHTPVLEYLLQSGANVDAVNLNGETALHEAARAGKDGACQVLMKRGANTSALNHDGQTPADLAQQHQHVRTAGLLEPDPQSVEKERRKQAYLRQSLAQQSAPSAPPVHDSSRVTYPVIDPPTQAVPPPPGPEPSRAEPSRGRRYGLPEDDDSDGWEPQIEGDWGEVEAPAVRQSQGGQLMQSLEQRPEASGQAGDPFWMIPGPVKWAAGSLGGVFNNVNPFKSPRQPATNPPDPASPQHALETALEVKEAQVSKMKQSKDHQELTETQLRRLKEQEDEIALLKRQLLDRSEGVERKQGTSIGASSSFNQAAEEGPSKGRHHLFDMPPARAPTARLISVEQIQEAANAFSQKLSETSSGTYYRGKLDGADVAVLVPKTQGGFLSQSDVKEAANKLAGLQTSLSSGELVHLRAYSADGCAVYDLHHLGSVEDSLRSRTPAPGSKPVRLDWKSRLAICLKTAQGLMELRKAGLYHSPASMCPSKVLLNADKEASLMTPSITSLISGPQGLNRHASYISPEVREGGSQGAESDVFALGLFLLQLITGNEASQLRQYVESAMRQGKLESILDPCAEGISTASAVPLAKLALRCTEFHAEDRPDLEHEILPAIFNLQEKSAAPAEASQEEPPDHLICPITQEVMEKPVILSDGYTYEESAIRQWLSTGKQVSPMTNQALENLILTPNYVIKSAASSWREKHPVVASENATKQESATPQATGAPAQNARILREVAEMNDMLQRGNQDSELDESTIDISDDSVITDDDLPSAPTHTYWDQQAAQPALEPAS